MSKVADWAAQDQSRNEALDFQYQEEQFERERLEQELSILGGMHINRQIQLKILDEKISQVKEKLAKLGGALETEEIEDFTDSSDLYQDSRPYQAEVAMFHQVEGWDR